MQDENKFIRCFLDFNLRSGHEGLMIALKKEGVKKLSKGEFVCFINRAKTALKLLTVGNMVLHLKMPTGEYLSLDTIKYIPHIFIADTMSLDYNKAKAWVVREKIKSK